MGISGHFKPENQRLQRQNDEAGSIFDLKETARPERTATIVNMPQSHIDLDGAGSLSMCVHFRDARDLRIKPLERLVGSKDSFESLAARRIFFLFSVNAVQFGFVVGTASEGSKMDVGRAIA